MPVEEIDKNDVEYLNTHPDEKPKITPLLEALKAERELKKQKAKRSGRDNLNPQSMEGTKDTPKKKKKRNKRNGKAKVNADASEFKDVAVSSPNPNPRSQPSSSGKKSKNRDSNRSGEQPSRSSETTRKSSSTYQPKIILSRDLPSK